MLPSLDSQPCDSEVSLPNHKTNCSRENQETKLKIRTQERKQVFSKGVWLVHMCLRDLMAAFLSVKINYEQIQNKQHHGKHTRFTGQPLTHPHPLPFLLFNNNSIIKKQLHCHYTVSHQNSSKALWRKASAFYWKSEPHPFGVLIMVLEGYYVAPKS